jgi:hypothetical protein
MYFQAWKWLFQVARINRELNQDVSWAVNSDSLGQRPSLRKSTLLQLRHHWARHFRERLGR